jgi:hypothetical protein
MSRGYPVKTPERVAEARRLREDGKTLAQIGAVWGIATATIHAWLSDSDGVLLAARRRASAQRCAGTCEGCGGPTDGSHGRENAPRLCRPCSDEERRIWTPDAVILAIEEWAAKYGEPPAVADWNAWGCKHEFHDEERAARNRRERAEGTCPDFMTVIRAFGTWNAAILAAGFPPRVGHGGGGNELRSRAQRAKKAAA